MGKPTDPYMFQIARESTVTLTNQIVENVVYEVEKGRLAEGMRLPSVRQLATKLGVSSHTAMVAYERLVSMGHLSARPGAGYFVASSPKRIHARQVELNVPPPDTPGGLARGLLDSEQGLLQVSSGFLPQTWMAEAFSGAEVVRAAKRAAANGAVAAPAGGVRIRSLIAERLQRRELPAAATNIVTTQGASHALHLIARALAAPGDVVFVDDPGYFFLQSQLADLGLRVIGIPRTEDGPDLDVLEKQATEYRPKAFFTQSVLQNPTGWNLPLPAAHRLLVAAERHDFMLVEDDIYAELSGDQVSRLAQIDGLERVVYVGGFSKVLSPAMRTGFLAAKGSIVEMVVALKMSNVLSGSMLEEEVLCEVMASGRLARHASRLRERIVKSRAPAVEALRKVGITPAMAAGAGPYLWCELPHRLSAAELAVLARAAGFLIAPGDMFSRSGAWRHHVRLNIAFAMHPRLLAFFDAHLG